MVTLKYDKKWYLDILLIAMAIFVFYFGYQVITTLRSESKQCIDQPFVYGASKMGNVSCSCTQYKDEMIYPFEFNDTSFKAYPVVKNFFDKYRFEP